MGGIPGPSPRDGPRSDRTMVRRLSEHAVALGRSCVHTAAHSALYQSREPLRIPHWNAKRAARLPTRVSDPSWAHVAFFAGAAAKTVAPTHQVSMWCTELDSAAPSYPYLCYARSKSSVKPKRKVTPGKEAQIKPKAPAPKKHHKICLGDKLRRNRVRARTKQREAKMAAEAAVKERAIKIKNLKRQVQ